MVDTDQIQKEFEVVREFYPDLKLIQKSNNSNTIRGILIFFAVYNDVEIEDQFHIEITIPTDYPESPPTTLETAERIPKDVDFHVNESGSLCLGTPLEIRMKFAENKSLIGYIENLLVPFLYSFSFKKKFKTMPYGELPHYHEGVLESYKGIFDTSSDEVASRLLRILAENNYRGHISCPCGSGKILRNCHGPTLLKINRLQNQEDYFFDFTRCLLAVYRTVEKIPNSWGSKKLVKFLRERKARLAQKK